MKSALAGDWASFWGEPPVPSGMPFVDTVSFSGSIASIPGLPSEDESPAGIILEDFTGFNDF
jgi:hypothetical protein